jgi:hypothetical protein
VASGGGGGATVEADDLEVLQAISGVATGDSYFTHNASNHLTHLSHASSKVRVGAAASGYVELDPDEITMFDGTWSLVMDAPALGSTVRITLPAETTTLCGTASICTGYETSNPTGSDATTFSANEDATGGSEPADGSGFKIEGGSGDKSFLWDATNDETDVNDDLNVTGYVATSAADDSRGVVMTDNTTTCPNPASGLTSLCSKGSKILMRAPSVAAIQLPEIQVACVVIEDLAAGDDSVEFFMPPYNVTVTGVGARCRGTCTPTLATITLEDRGGNAMTIAGTNPTVATTGASTFAGVSGAQASLLSGEGIAFDVTNTPNPATDEYTICIKYTVDP